MSEHRCTVGWFRSLAARIRYVRGRLELHKDHPVVLILEIRSANSAAAWFKVDDEMVVRLLLASVLTFSDTSVEAPLDTSIQAHSASSPRDSVVVTP